MKQLSDVFHVVFKYMSRSLSLYLQTFKEPRNRFRQAGNRFLGSLEGLQIRAML
jgi:hypothetical protein